MNFKTIAVNTTIEITLLFGVLLASSAAPNGNSRISGKFPISFFQAIMSQRLDAVMSNGRCLVTVRYTVYTLGQ